MKVTVWQAWASNNSGSYTLVGCLPSAELASEVATEIAQVCREHSGWHETQSHSGQNSLGSPLEAFVRKNGLHWRDDMGRHDDWPNYGPEPRVSALGYQVVVHVPYTVSMPPSFGELIYRRGGRVELELVHSHVPVVSEIRLHLPSEASAAELESNVAALLAELRSEALLAAFGVEAGSEPSFDGHLEWCRNRSWMDATLTIGAIFTDIPAGCAAIAAIGSRHGATCEVRLFEAVDVNAPLEYLRKRQREPSAFDE